MDTPLNIVIDTREQTPWAFPPELCHIEFQKLEAGDYALANDPRFSIERKNLDDFVGTIASGWERFQRELHVMDGFDRKVMIVEGRVLHCCFYENENGELQHPIHNHPMVSPQFVLKQISVLTMAGVSVLFADTADIAAGLAFAILKERQKELEQDRQGFA